MKKRFWILIILVFCAAALPMMASAETKSGTCGDGLTWTLTDSGVLTISGSGAMANYSLSSEKPWGNAVTQVEIQEGVTAIGEEAFSECSGLTGVVIPSSVTSIGDWAFSESGLTSIMIPHGVTTIGKYAFAWCGSLTDITIPASVTTIGSSAFYACDSLTDAAIPKSVTTIGDSAFWDCRSLKHVTIPSGIKAIEEYTFYGCDSLTGVVIPNGVNSIGAYAFAWCDSLTDVAIPNSVITIDKYAFSNCSSLAGVKVPKNTAGIGGYAFSECHALTSIIILGNETSIEQTAFFGSSNNLVISCYDGSKAQQFAGQNGLKAELMEKPPLERPEFFKQPISVFVAQGETAVFEATASDAESYQWFFRVSSEEDWQPVSEIGDFTVYRVIADQQYNGCQYTCVAKNEVGSSYSNIVTLNVISEPVITAQPVDATVYEGGKVSFEVKATDAENYRWFYLEPGEKLWKNVSKDGNSAVLTFTATKRHNGFQYMCRLKNKAGTVMSDAASLTVSSEIIITAQPKDVTVNVDGTATFEAAATGAVSCQWYYQKPGETEWNKVTKNGKGTVLTLTATKRHDGYKYKCVFKNKVNSLESNVVSLTVNAEIVITAQPKNVTVNADETATFEAAATGAVSCQWYYQKPGETEWNKVTKNGKGAVLTLTAKPRHNGYQYKCVFTNAVDTLESDIVSLTVYAKPAITVQPVNVTVNAEEKVTLQLTATDAEAYQWYYQKPGETKWNKVEKGGASDIYTLTAKARHNGYQYRCEVKNRAGTVVSDIVTLTVATSAGKTEQTTAPTQTPAPEQTVVPQPTPTPEQEQPDDDDEPAVG